ncbi:MAG: AbrB/MazE/SpoVT family DNA-binding domain-containing protein [Ileibacterium sp.]|nr:AbrB/MazE/SpoVT family DNA-binding domain-containing protein [Ileibacterium sp.]
MENYTTLTKWGNSQGIRIPKQLIAQLSMNIGDSFEIRLCEGQIILVPMKKKRKTVMERFQEYEGPLRLEEEWDSVPVGKEVW